MIYVFDTHSKPFQASNCLKEFLYYLKYSGVTGVIDFSYSNSTDSLHHHLSIKENLILDSVPTSLIKNNELNLVELIQQSENTALLRLIETLSDLDKKVSALDIKTLKVTSLVKAILSKSEYLFLVDPQQYLDTKSSKLVKQCLLYEAEHSHRKIFLGNCISDYWLDISNHVISKDQKQNYILTKNPLNPSTAMHVLPFKKAG